MFDKSLVFPGPVLSYFIIVGFSTTLTCLLAVIWSIRPPPPTREIDDQTKAKRERLIGSIATINALLLSFVIVQVWQKYNSVRDTVAAEAGALMNLARDASTLKEPERSILLHQMDQYATQVAQEDWPSLAAAGHHDIHGLMHASTTLSTLWNTVGDDTFLRNAITSNMLSNLGELSKQRAHRFALAREGVTNTIWAVVLAATVSSIVLAMAKPGQPVRAQLPILLFYSMFVSTLLWMITDIDNPFSGAQAIDATPFVHAAWVIRGQEHHKSMPSLLPSATAGEATHANAAYAASAIEPCLNPNHAAPRHSSATHHATR